jgi:hypothetical protein
VAPATLPDLYAYSLNKMAAQEERDLTRAAKQRRRLKSMKKGRLESKGKIDGYEIVNGKIVPVFK